MNILLSNDDGYKSLGLKTLKNSLEKFGKVLTVAPHRDISASSSCLSVHSPVKVNKISNNVFRVYGTPADCVHIATRGILKKYPDIVFSGLNLGSNMGDDVIYSGTIGAAIEGRHAKYGSYAISLVSKNPKYEDDMQEKVDYVINFIFSKLIKHPAIYNINIPDIPYSQIKGLKFSKQGSRNISKRANKVIRNKKNYYNIGEVGKGNLMLKSDFLTIHKKYVSVTPIKIDMTDYETYHKLK